MASAFRVAKRRYASDHDQMLSGLGAATNGGRWNSIGKRMLYTSGTKSLAMLEIAVHLNNAAVLEAYDVCEIDVADHLIEFVDIGDLPNGWDEKSINPAEAQAFGDLWIDHGMTPVLAVPSTIINTEYNLLINPAHDDYDQLTPGPIEPFPFDERVKQ